mmetsp:Transcript_19193/g.63419  ORF Transcript_19193/g.63419 Transcript_19193/m.63419 type:complete len:242 (+) Transcript_19193:123-848(+)
MHEHPHQAVAGPEPRQRPAQPGGDGDMPRDERRPQAQLPVPRRAAVPAAGRRGRLGSHPRATSIISSRSTSLCATLPSAAPRLASSATRRRTPSYSTTGPPCCASSSRTSSSPPPPLSGSSPPAWSDSSAATLSAASPTLVKMTPDGPRFSQPATYRPASPETRPPSFGTTPRASSNGTPSIGRERYPTDVSASSQGTSSSEPATAAARCDAPGAPCSSVAATRTAPSRPLPPSTNSTGER